MQKNIIKLENSELAKMVNKKKVLLLLILIGAILLGIGVVIIGACLYGAPDSPIVNIVGKDIKNFVDMTNRERKEVRLEGDYLILYHQHSPSKNHLYLKNTENNKVLRIFFEEREYSPGHGLIIPEKNLVVFSLIDWRVSPFNRTLLKVYDYLNGIYIDEKEIVANDEDLTLTNLIVSKDGEYLGVELLKDIIYGIIGTIKYTYNFKCFRLYENILIPTTEISYEEIKRGEKESDVQTGSKCITKDGDELRVFRVSQESDFLPANYKPKYNGLYIHSKKTKVNRRISLNNEFFTGQNLWIDNGSKLIRGEYLYDTTGEKRESRLIEGTILYIAKLQEDKKR